MSARRLMVFAGVLVAAAFLAAGPVVAQSTTPGAGARPGPTDDTLLAIRNLKLQADDAARAKDWKRALDRYQMILRLDPDDSLARQQIKDIEDRLSKQDEEARITGLTLRDEAAKQRRVEQLLSQAEQAVIDANTSGDAAPLVRAQQLVTEAKKYARPDDPEVQRIEGMITQVLDARRVRLWEIWGLVALVVLVPIIGAVVYVRRTGRVLEIVNGPQSGDRFVLEKDSVSVGAGAAEVDWAVSDPLRKISRRHFDVIRHSRRYFLVDQSTNGTLLNGRVVQRGEPVLLKRGDRIGLSDEVTLLFR